VVHEARGVFNKPGSGFEATGVFRKRGPMMRCTFDAGVAGIQYGRTKWDITREPVDESTDGFVGIRYFPRRWELLGDEAKAAVVEYRAHNADEAWAAGDMTANGPNPLNPMLGNDNQPFAGLRIAEIRRLDGEHLECVCRERKEKKWRRVAIWETRNRRIVFWTKPALPVVEKIEDVVERTSPDDPSKVLGRDEFQAILSDFQECGGGWVARRVLLVAIQAGDVIRVRQWQSEDLGNQRPADSDFAVAIPADVRVVGLKQGFPPGTARSLDPSKINLPDLDRQDPAGEPLEGPPLGQTSLGSLLLAWGLGLVAFGLIAGWYLLGSRAGDPAGGHGSSAIAAATPHDTEI
jgi:hypothetical protein